jgi:hypothetical protein
MTPYSQHFIHIIYSGGNKFSLSLQQHNPSCDENIDPYPETWDSVEAARYAFCSEDQDDIWIPMSHFQIDHTRVNAIALESFYTSCLSQLYRVELIPPSQVPAELVPPEELANGNVVFKCKVRILSPSLSMTEFPD